MAKSDSKSTTWCSLNRQRLVIGMTFASSGTVNIVSMNKSINIDMNRL